MRIHKAGASEPASRTAELRARGTRERGTRERERAREYICICVHVTSRKRRTAH